MNKQILNNIFYLLKPALYILFQRDRLAEI